MTEFEAKGRQLRADAKMLVYQYMQASDSCQPGQNGLKQAVIFRACGFDWGEYEKATSSNQQHWVAALIRELKAEGKVERVSESGPWRLR